ncbi:hypothetical protein ACRE1S_03680 [Helicobacter himalayensis]|uniref:hypothetical protein n=1 Tax=Helicobacter himalayensis TaxID=1591088 RepID=UPI003D6DB20A
MFQYEKNKIIFLPQKKKDTKNAPFYLKVHLQNQHFVFLCLQHWIDIAETLRADIYIVCDNLELKRMIYKKIIFKNPQISFITSRNKMTKSIVKKLLHKYWYGAGMAHLTTFYHAKKMGYPSFWNIDADDTIILSQAELVAKALKHIESYADTNNINIFSLDMHRSRTRSRTIWIDWTFGITYTKNYECFIQAFEKGVYDYKALNKLSEAINLDIVVAYLKNTNFNAKIETFYIENSHFIHWCKGDFFTTFSAYICVWHNEKVEFPIYTEILQDEKLGIFDIADDCIRFECGFNEDENLKFMFEYLTYPYFKQAKWQIESKYLDI